LPGSGSEQAYPTEHKKACCESFESQAAMLRHTALCWTPMAKVAWGGSVGDPIVVSEALSAEVIGLV
jgi:hypothetical protein